MSKEGLNLSSEEIKLPCTDKNIDPDLFFPIVEIGRAAQEQIKEAKALCEACPAQEACLKVALTTPEEYGIWGGRTKKERDAIRGRAARSRA